MQAKYGNINYPSQSTPVVECESQKDVCRKGGLYVGTGVEYVCVCGRVYGGKVRVCVVSVVGGEREEVWGIRGYGYVWVLNVVGGEGEEEYMDGRVR